MSEDKDRDLQAEVIQELEFQPSIDASAIGVAAHEGAVTLTGRVRSYEEKVAAANAARRVYGVRAVADELVVHLPDTYVRDDTDIAGAIARLLEWSVTVPLGAVTAKVSKGWVTLEGNVEWDYQSEAAMRLVRPVKGVKGVSNLINARPKPKEKDVKAKITAALHRQAQIDARRIWLEMVDGKVVLHGQVSSWSEAEAARTAAVAAPGVMQVESRLTIVP